MTSARPDVLAADQGSLLAQFTRPRSLFLANMATKVILILLLLHAVVFPNLPQYAGKGIGARLVTYPISALLVPIIFVALGARRPKRYPHVIDICVALPFLLDTLGNALNLFDEIDWFDDAMHYINWIPWTLAFGFFLRYLKLGRLNAACLAAGYGAITHILWEILEYFAFIKSNPNEFDTAYTDTLGDLALSLSGSVTAAVLLGTVLWKISAVRDDEIAA